MLTVISPAKKLDMTRANLPESLAMTTPDFAEEARYLAKTASQLKAEGLVRLMGISEKLAALNIERFQNFGSQDTKPAVLAFAGDTYRGLEAATWEVSQLVWAQDHLRILSGLYGLLRPLDAIEPYRLEMGSRLHTDRGSSLYEYWGGRLAEALDAQASEVGAEALLNCASKEYFGAVCGLRLRVITPVFKERRGGESRIVSFYAKAARGAFARFVIRHQIETVGDLRDFDSGGYIFEPSHSDDETLVFIRDHG